MLIALLCQLKGADQELANQVLLVLLEILGHFKIIINWVFSIAQSQRI